MFDVSIVPKKRSFSHLLSGNIMIENVHTGQGHVQYHHRERGRGGEVSTKEKERHDEKKRQNKMAFLFVSFKNLFDLLLFLFRVK